MEWFTVIKEAIQYMETNLLTLKGPEEVAGHVYISTLYLQRGFQILTGYTIGEYVRNRRLYQAANELTRSNKKVLDIALQYGYETAESFTKAFVRFHGATPADVRKGRASIKSFLPLRIQIKIEGGESMEYVVEKMSGFQVIGFSRNFSYETLQQEIPKFWGEVFATIMKKVQEQGEPKTELERAFLENGIGEFGVCLDETNEYGTFRYLIAGRYKGGAVPEGMTLYSFEDSDWVKFTAIGPMPHTMQTLNEQVWNEWLPGNKDFELIGQSNIEWYSEEGTSQDDDYVSGLWIPVKRK